MKPTTEELALQLLATCMLINAQGIYLATLDYTGHNVWVSVEPRAGLEEDDDAHRYSAALTGMLSHLQDYLQKEATPCAA